MKVKSIRYRTSKVVGLYFTELTSWPSKCWLHIELDKWSIILPKCDKGVCQAAANVIKTMVLTILRVMFWLHCRKSALFQFIPWIFTLTFKFYQHCTISPFHLDFVWSVILYTNYSWNALCWVVKPVCKMQVALFGFIRDLWIEPIDTEHIFVDGNWRLLITETCFCLRNKSSDMFVIALKCKQ